MKAKWKNGWQVSISKAGWQSSRHVVLPTNPTPPSQLPYNSPQLLASGEAQAPGSERPSPITLHPGPPTHVHRQRPHCCLPACQLACMPLRPNNQTHPEALSPANLQRVQVCEGGLAVPVPIQLRGLALAALGTLHQSPPHAAPAAQEQQVHLHLLHLAS